MIRSRVITLLVLAALSAGGRSSAAPPSKPAWSPDGEWIAYVIEPSTSPLVRASCLIDQPRPEPAPGPSRRWRLWATRPKSGVSVLLDESNGPLSAPGWSPDGRSIAFGRAVVEAGRSHFDVVRLDGTTRRVVSSQPIPDGVTPYVRSAVAWSPDGRYLAVPRLGPEGLDVLSAESGQFGRRTIEHGSYPSWSPDGTKLYYITPGTPDRLDCLNVALVSGRVLAAVGQVDGPPVIARDGQSAIVLTRTRSEVGSERAEVVRIRLEDGRTSLLNVLTPETSPNRPVTVTRTSFSVDRDGGNIFALATLKDQPRQVAWVRGRESQVYKKFPIVDPSLEPTDLSLSPIGGLLAARLGEAGLPLICDLDSMAMTPLAPDDRTRDAWASLLIETAAALIRENSPRAILGGRAIERTVPLLMPGEISTDSDVSLRLGRIGRIGRPLCDGATASPAWEDARFLFDYLRSDFPSALKELHAIADREGSEETNRRRLALRAHVFAGLGDYDRARATLGYLKSVESWRSRRRIESTSRGEILTDSPPPDLGWPSYAIGRVEILERDAKLNDDGAPMQPQDHRNPDAPVPGLGLDLEAPAVPAVPEAEVPPLIPRRRVP